MSDLEYTFNWHNHQDNFAGWLLVHLIAEDRKSGGMNFDELSEVTDGFRNVTIAMQVNGISVPTEKFISLLPEVMDDMVGKKAKEIVDMDETLQNVRSGLDEVEDFLKEINAIVHDRVRQVFARNGIDIPDWV